MLLLGLSLLASIAAPQSSATQEQSGPHLRFLDTKGETSRVPHVGLALRDPREVDVWRIEPRGFAIPASTKARGPAIRVELVNGDRLQGWVQGGAGEALLIELEPGVRLPVGIDHISSLRIASDGRAGAENPGDPGGNPAWSALESRQLEPAPEGDRLYRRTSRAGAGAILDAIDGTIESFEETGVRFDSAALGLSTYPWREVAALFVEVLGSGRTSTAVDRAPVVLDLRSGSRLRGTLGGLGEQGCTLLAAVSSQELLIPWHAIRELVVDDGSHLFLSELAAREELGRGAPFGDDEGMLWDHRMDRSVHGGAPLISGGVVYGRGIGTHAPTRVIWDLPEGMQQLRGKVGIDDSVLSNRPAARGSVIFRVFLDGELAWESRVLSGGSPVVTLPSIALGNARELALEADPVENFQGDRANWLDMLLVR